MDDFTIEWWSTLYEFEVGNIDPNHEYTNDADIDRLHDVIYYRRLESNDELFYNDWGSKSFDFMDAYMAENGVPVTLFKCKQIVLRLILMNINR